MIVSPNSAHSSFDALFIEKAGSFWKIRLGEKTLDFSKEEMAHADFDFKTGSVSLFDAKGRIISRLMLPDLQSIFYEIQKLQLESVAIKLQDVPDFLRWLKSQSLRKEHILLILEELENIIPQEVEEHPPQIRGVQQVNFHKVMDLMPVEIVQMALDYTFEKLGEPMTSLQHFLSRVDLEKDPEIAAFLTGKTLSFTKILPLVEELMQRTQVLVRKAPAPLNTTCIQKLLEWLGDHPAKPAMGGITPVAMKDILAEAGLFELPNFSLFSSLDEMESEWNQQTVRKFNENPKLVVENILVNYLNKDQFPELCHFFSNTENTWNDGHAFESALLFSDQKKVPSLAPLEPIKPRQLEQFIKHNKGLEKLLSPMSQEVFQTGSNAFLKLTHLQKLGFWVLDHLTYARTPLLTDFFNQKYPISLFTEPLKRELKELLDQCHFSPSRPDLKVVLGSKDFHARFSTLIQQIQKMDISSKIPVYKPLAPVTAAILDHFFMVDQPKPENAGLSRLWNQHVGGKVPASLSEGVAAMYDADLPDEPHSEVLTSLLKRKVRHFKTMALLDAVMELKVSLKDTTPQKGSQEVQKVRQQLSGTSSQIIKWALPDMDHKILSEFLPGSFQVMEPGEKLEFINQTLLEWPKNFSEKIRLLELSRQFSMLFPEGYTRGTQEDNLNDAPHGLRMNQNPDDILKDSGVKASPINPETRMESAISELPQIKAISQWIDDVLLFLTHRKTVSWSKLPSLTLEKQSRKSLNSLLELSPKEMTQKLETLSAKGFSPAAIKELHELLDHLRQNRHVQEKPEEWVNKLFQMIEKNEQIQQLPEKLSRFLNRLHEWNRFQSVNNAPLFFNLPISFGAEQKNLEILYKPLVRKEKKNRFLIVLHLDFDQLGPFRADILKESMDLRATFWTATTKMQQKIQAHLPKLQGQLIQAGLERVDIQVKMVAERAKRKPSQLAESYHQGAFDLKA